MWCTWCFSQRTCGLVGVRRLSAVGYRLSAIGCPLSDVRCPMAAGTVFPKVDTPYGQALTGLRVDGPLGRRFLRGLSLTRLWREGCGRAPLNYRRRPLMKKSSQPPWRAKEIPPLVANATTLPGGKHVTGFSVAYGSLRIQFLCHPRSSVGRQKESALMGRLGALLRPTWRSYAGPPQGHYGCLAMGPCLYRKA